MNMKSVNIGVTTAVGSLNHRSIPSFLEKGFRVLKGLLRRLWEPTAVVGGLLKRLWEPTTVIAPFVLKI